MLHLDWLTIQGLSIHFTCCVLCVSGALKGNKGKASRLVCFPVFHQKNFYDSSIFTEILLQGLLIGLSVQAPNEELSRPVCLRHLWEPQRFFLHTLK